MLATLWRLGSASVRELHEQAGAAQGLVYTTTAKVVDRLRAKGLIQRQRAGATFRYRPRVAPAEVERARARTALQRLLGDAPRAAAAALVAAVSDLDPALLAELEQAVAAHKRNHHGT